MNRGPDDDDPGKTPSSQSQGDLPIMPPRHLKTRPQQRVNTWLLSFTDVTGLMLTFFVMLFSMSDPNRQTWSDMAVSLGVEFNTSIGATGQAGPHAHPETNRRIEGRGLDLGYLSTVLYRHLEQADLADTVVMTADKGRIILTFPGRSFFEAGAEGMSEEGKKTLYALGQNFRGIRNRIEIHGYAAAPPSGSTGKLKTNWGRALARAGEAAAILEESGYNQPLTLLGNADNKQSTDQIDIVVREYTPQILRGF